MTRLLQKLGLRRRHRRQAPRSDALVQLSPHPQDCLTIEDSFSGIFICGSTGSGKTSGPGATLALSMLKAGYGILVLTTKPGEADSWRAYARCMGREKDLYVMREGGDLRLNFLDYAANIWGLFGPVTEDIVDLFMTLLESSESGSTRSPEPFWDRSTRQLLRNVIDLLVLAGEPLTMQCIDQIIQTAPRYPDEVRDVSWRQRSYCAACLDRAQHSEGTDFDVVTRYWLDAFPEMDERTRSNIVTTFSTMADVFSRGMLRDLFGGGTTLMPEYVMRGGIIVIDLPVKRYGQAGRFAQVLMKRLFQVSVERQYLADDPGRRPVALFVDEYQEFVSRHDRMFQATARSSRVASVYMTQSISTLHAQMAGFGDGRASTDALLANLSTKVLLSNSDAETNEWSERLFAKDWRYRSHTNVSTQSGARQQAGNDRPAGPNISSGINSSLESNILASTFLGLRTGWPRNRYLVDTLFHTAGRQWAASGGNSLKVTFQQHIF